MNINNQDTKSAEVSVLGSVLLSNGSVLDEMTVVGADFASPRLGKAFDLMRVMRAEGSPIDTITFVYDKRFLALNINGADVHEWTSIVPTSVSGPYYSEIVKEMSVRRRLEITARRIADACQTWDFALLTEAARADIDAALGVAASTVQFVEDEMMKTLEELSEPSPAFPTPWRGLTDAIGGFRPGCLYVVGARPGIGKTSVGLQSAIELGKHGAVAFSSLEMRREEIHKRILSSQLSIPMDSVMNNRLYEDDWKKIAENKDRLRPSIAIDDRANVTIQDIRTHVRSVSRKKPLAGILVDYLQLMATVGDRPRHEVVAEFSRQLKIMARDFNVPVIALSQLNRQSEGRQDKKPSLSDLRESGAIEQDADVVMLLHTDDNNDFYIDVAKNRHGAPTVVKLEWQGEYARAVTKGWIDVRTH